MRSQKLNTKQKSSKDVTDVLQTYFELLWKNKYWIILITGVFSVIWLFIYNLYLKENLQYATSTIIRFEATTTAVTDFASMEITGKIAILQTRSFLSKVADSLKLRLFLHSKGINRFKLFKKITISDTAHRGEYKLTRVGDVLNVYYSNEEESIENQSIFSSFIDLDYPFALELNGIEVEFDPQIIMKHSEIEFGYLSDRYVVEYLRTRLNGVLDRSGTLLTIYYADSHPEACAEIANTLTNMYLDKLLEFKKFRTSAVVQSFEEQLQVSHEEVKKSEDALRRFREKNPYLFLSSSGASLVRDLSDSESELNKIDGSIHYLENLNEQKDDMGYDYKNLTYQEILSYLSSSGVSGANILLERFKDLGRVRGQLLAENYSSEHPRVKEVESQLVSLQDEIDKLIIQYKQYLRNQRKGLQNEINRGQQNLMKLPREEIQLAELQRDQAVKQQIYSNILVRFNEAKVSDATVVPDAFLVEDAVIPITTSNPMGKFNKLLIGPFMAFLFSIGLFIILDYLDQTVKEGEDVESKLSLPVLATLPVIGDEKEYPDFIDENIRIDQKLITSDYAPHIAGESFRLLRTKLLMRDKFKSHGFIIASLNPGEGKSLVASNLAITFAQQKIQTLLIDCDLRRGVLHNSFIANKRPGLTDILIGNKPIDIQEISNIAQKTHIPNLYLISTGTQIPNPSELLGGLRMKDLYEIVKQNYGMIIFDTPPIEFIPDALVLNSFIHQIIFVVRYGRTNISKMSKKIIEISDFQDDFAGVVINASSHSMVKKYDSYSYYKY